VLALLEVRHRSVDQPHRPHQIHLEALPPAFLIRTDRKRADIGHHNVDPVHLRRGITNPAGQCRRIGNVKRRAVDSVALSTQCALRLRNFLAVARAKGHGASFGGKRFHDRTADPLGASSDDCP